MSPSEVLAAIGGVVKLLLFFWVLFAIALSFALPFLVVSAVRSLRRIAAQLERIAERGERPAEIRDETPARRFNVLTP